MSADLIEIVHNFGQPRVLVVGDVMLDRYVWGDAERVSQEAPVILLRADRREDRLGGASSVATMLRALGAKVSLAGVVGADADGDRVRALLTELGVDHEGVMTDGSRPTTLKERFVGRAQHKHPQQMMRVDYESRQPLSESLSQQMIQFLARKLAAVDVVLVSDYDKGVCTPKVLAALIAIAAQAGIRTIVDPARTNDYRKYHGCSAITPNRVEAGLASGRTLQTLEDALTAASDLRERLDLEAAIVTLDRDGMAMVHADGRQRHFPTRPRQVYDITGAGDMVLAALGVAIASGVDYASAIRLANVAGGLEVEKIGVATVTRDEILRDLLHARATNKLADLTTLKLQLETQRRHGQRVVFTNGCFDVLHAGHVQYLQEARAQGDILVVGLNSDASVRDLKGPDRPVNPVEARALVLAGLECVDYITVFDDATPLALIEELRPDVLVKGADYSWNEVVGAEFVESYGGRVHLAPLTEGVSTTRLLKKLRAA